MERSTHNISEVDIHALNRLFGAPGSFYCVVGFDGAFRTVSSQWTQLLGMSEDEIYRSSLLELIHADERAETIRAFSKLSSQNRETIHYESRVLCGGGNYRWLSWHIVSDPAASHVYALATDITEQKRLEELFHVTLESAPIGMLMSDTSGRIRLCNAQAETEFGYSRDELMGQPVEMLVPERYREQHNQERHNYLMHPVTRQMGADRELFARRKDGAEFPVEIGLHPVETTEGTYILAIILDITERKRARQMLERHSNLMEVAEHTALVGGWEYDLVTDELYWTRETYRIHGLDPDSWIPTVEAARQ